MHQSPSPRKTLRNKTAHGKVREITVMINLVAAWVLARGEGEHVVGGKHLSQTAVVRDQSRSDAKVTSDLDNVDLLLKEACIVIE